MSLTSALNSAVSGLRAQSTAIAAVSENIANSSTIAYKGRGVSFQSLVTNSSSSSSRYATGSVLYSTYQDVSAQGEITSSGDATDIAIQGNGFFVVSDSLSNKPSAYNYSRNGNFETDADGFLINSEGYYLLGQALDDDGNVIAANSSDLNSLEPINTSAVTGKAKATTEITMDVNLPADAAVGDIFETAAEVFDSLGVSHTISQSWEKTGANTWTLTMSNPVLTSDGTTTSGTLTPTTIDITFDGDGNLASTTPDPVSLSITGFTSGANNSTIALDLGTPGSTEGLTQFSSNTDTPDIDVQLIDQDGLRYGQLSGLEISDDGIVTATFDNGLRQAIYQIPLATFPNPGGLTHVNGTVYDENELAGNYNLRKPGEGSAGEIFSNALELSTTDTSEEFNKMIIAQQAYSAASQIVSTTDEMFSSLIQAVS
jgi:flagellar hook protein FlgE